MQVPRRLLVAALLLLATPARAAEPQVAFGIKSGWLSFAVTQDDKPVPDPRVRVYDASGNLFAEGEGGTDGKGSFPLPPGALLRVEVQVGDRSADVISLTREADRVVPDDVLLSFGLAPCCRLPARGGGSATIASGGAGWSAAIPVWLWALVSVAFTGVGAAFLWMGRRPIVRQTPLHPEEPA